MQDRCLSREGVPSLRCIQEVAIMRTKQIIGLIVLGCTVASLGVLAGLITWLGPPTGLMAGFLVAAGLIGTYVLVVGPWQRRWGATKEEVRRAMPGDALLRPDAP